MKYINLISNFAEFKELKNIDNATLIGVLEDVFRHALQKQFESDENFDVSANAISIGLSVRVEYANRLANTPSKSRTLSDTLEAT